MQKGRCTQPKREKPSWVNWFIYTVLWYKRVYFYKYVLYPTIVCLCVVNFFIFVYLRTIACLWRHIRMQLFLFVHLYSWTRVGALWVTRIANIIYWTCVFVNRSRLKFIQNLAFVFFDSYPCIVDFIKYLLERSWLYPMKNTRKHSNTNRNLCSLETFSIL